ncbi:hypothetical protein [Paenibacillus sp. OV219]|uniref:hypothetical protein n=1 Tax=Paenibacillus sp. OV219 TaxID=1884377 RepID=UPI0008CC83D3|nr:hypothetical protein [Paenibacillus sp. OV219]SEO80575.1 hypothetical protein SAMN05518847_11149 [Paenibacillus sp. OV219]
MSVWLVGCGSDAKETTTVTTEEGSAEVSKDGDKVTVKSDEGNVTITTDENAKKLPKDFPQDIPLPDDAAIVNTINMSSDAMKSFMISLTTGMSLSQAADFYREALKNDGYEFADTVAQDQISLVGENDTYNMLIIIKPDVADAGRSSVMMTFGSLQK